jgi:hypothetical protein
MRRAVVLCVAIAIVASTAAAIPIAVTNAIEPAIIMVPVAAPFTIVVPAPAEAPPAAQAEPVDVPQPADEPVTTTAPRPRASAPRLDATYVFPASDNVADECGWDDGFPAISADGTLIATKYFPDDAGRDNPGLSIRLIDVRSSRIVRHALILAPNEADVADDERPQLQARIDRRVDRIQHTLDVQRFRTLVPLGTTDQDLGEVNADVSKVHAEFSGTAIRIIDPTTSSVIWQHRIVAPGAANVSDDDLCGSWNLRAVTAWWDPTAKTVLVNQQYATGGCLCAIEEVEHVRRI